MKPSLSIGYIQYDIQWENRDVNFAYLDKVIDESYRDERLIVLPELFANGFSMNAQAIAEQMDGQTIVWMWSVAKQYGCVVCGSVPIRSDEKVYNRCVFVDQNGVLDYYDKKHLFTPAGEHEAYAKGKQNKIIEIDGWKIKPLICYDLRFPSCALNEENGYDLLIYVASWPEKRIRHWDRLLVARAIENQAFCLGVNRVGEDGNGFTYSGHSALYNYNGDPISKANELEGYFRVTLDQGHLAFRAEMNFLTDRQFETPIRS